MGWLESVANSSWQQPMQEAWTSSTMALQGWGTTGASGLEFPGIPVVPADQNLARCRQTAQPMHWLRG